MNDIRKEDNLLGETATAGAKRSEIYHWLVQVTGYKMTQEERIRFTEEMVKYAAIANEITLKINGQLKEDISELKRRFHLGRKNKAFHKPSTLNGEKEYHKPSILVVRNNNESA